MANITDTFAITTDSGLTIEFGLFEDLIHQTDESDNPQDLDPLYIGSQNSGRTLKASSDPGVDDITITPTDICPQWQDTTAYVLLDEVQPTANYGVPGYVFQCTTAGTSDATEPVSWPTTVGSTVVDGTVVWTCLRPKHDITEITLAVDDDTDLDTNTPGGVLNLGNTILGGTVNAKILYIRVENNVNIVSNNSSFPDISLVINSVTEY